MTGSGGQRDPAGLGAADARRLNRQMTLDRVFLVLLVLLLAGLAVAGFLAAYGQRDTKDGAWPYADDQVADLEHHDGLSCWEPNQTFSTRWSCTVAAHLRLEPGRGNEASALRNVAIGTAIGALWFACISASAVVASRAGYRTRVMRLVGVVMMAFGLLVAPMLVTAALGSPAEDAVYGTPRAAVDPWSIPLVATLGFVAAAVVATGARIWRAGVQPPMANLSGMGAMGAESAFGLRLFQPSGHVEDRRLLLAVGIVLSVLTVFLAWLGWSAHVAIQELENTPLDCDGAWDCLGAGIGRAFMVFALGSMLIASLVLGSLHAIGAVAAFILRTLRGTGPRPPSILAFGVTYFSFGAAGFIGLLALMLAVRITSAALLLPVILLFPVLFSIFAGAALSFKDGSLPPRSPETAARPDPPTP